MKDEGAWDCMGIWIVRARFLPSSISPGPPLIIRTANQKKNYFFFCVQNILKTQPSKMVLINGIGPHEFPLVQFCLRRELRAPGTKGGPICICVGSVGT